MPSRLRETLESALFPKHAATNLAVMRILIGCYAIWLLDAQRWSAIHTCTETALRYFDPVGVLAWMRTPLADGVFAPLYDACVVASILFTLGIASRVIAPLFAALLLFVLTYRQSFSFIYHTENLLVLHVGVLALARSSNVLSIDACLRRLQLPGTRLVLSRAPASPSWRYGWPAQLMVLLTGVTYWVAGMAKLGASGIGWVTDATLLDHIGNNALRYHLFEGGASALTYVVYEWPTAVWWVLGVGSLALELGAPLAVLSQRLALLFTAALWGLHWGIRLLMGIVFWYQLAGLAYVPFVRWDRLAFFARRTLRRARARRRPIKSSSVRASTTRD